MTNYRSSKATALSEVVLSDHLPQPLQLDIAGRPTDGADSIPPIAHRVSVRVGGKSYNGRRTATGPWMGLALAARPDFPGGLADGLRGWTCYRYTGLWPFSEDSSSV
jgi:hypothetical protein